jgi:hypothetical protein
MIQTTAQHHVIDVTASLSAVLATKKHAYPSHVNRISALDDPCMRRLYYMRHDWDKARPVDDGLQGIFETGTLLEPVIGRIVSEAGAAASPRWRIVGSQTPTSDALLKQYQISGSIDGFLQVEADGGRWETLGVVDIKTMSGNIFPRVETYDDLARYPWTRKYRGQVMLYALAHNVEMCFLLLVNKQNLYQMRLLAFPLDMAYCEALLAKAKTVNDAVAVGAAPDGVDDPDVCPKCQFYSFCAPDMTSGGNLIVSDNEELEVVMERLDELSPTAKEYADLEEQRDKMLIKGQNVACGRFLVTWKELTVSRKASEASTSPQWRKKIVSTPR